MYIYLCGERRRRGARCLVRTHAPYEGDDERGDGCDGGGPGCHVISLGVRKRMAHTIEGGGKMVVGV